MSIRTVGGPKCMIKKALLLLLGLCCILVVHAQENPYYKEIGKRDIDEVEYLPNLDIKKRRIYLGGAFGFRFSNSKFSNTAISRYSSEMNNNIVYYFNVGYSHNSKWMMEAGYLNNPMYLNTVIDLGGARVGEFRFNTGSNFDAAYLRFKYNILTLNRVSQNAFLRGTVGLQYSPSLRNRFHTARRIAIPVSGSLNSQDTLRFNVLNQSEGLGLAPEFGFEIGGDIVEQVEIGMFVNTVVRPRKSFYNDLRSSFNQEVPVSTIQNIAPFELNFGMFLKWNLIGWYKYEDKVD